VEVSDISWPDALEGTAFQGVVQTIQLFEGFIRLQRLNLSKAESTIPYMAQLLLYLSREDHRHHHGVQSKP